MGLGFSVALTIIGLVREILGAHKVFGVSFYELAEKCHMPASVLGFLDRQYPIAIFVMAPGAFFVLAALVAFLNSRKLKAAKVVKADTSCITGDHDCANCNEKCEHRFYDEDGIDGSVYEKHLQNDEKEDE